MIHQILNINEYKINIDYTVEKTLKPFKEEVLDHLYKLYRTNGELPLLFSGGMDSTFILRSLVELGIKPRTLSFSFTKEPDEDKDCVLVKSLCKKYGVPEPEFFFIEENSFFEYASYLIHEKNIGYPMLHGYYMNYLLDSIPHQQFSTGMGSEFKLKNNVITLPIGPQLVKQNNPYRLFDFASSQTFLSYINHEQFLLNYKIPLSELQEIDGRVDLWYIRDLIYSSCYSDIVIRKKSPPLDSHIAEIFYEKFMPIIRQNHPVMMATKPFTFNVEEYFNRKKEDNVS